jgi:ATP synthase protein I
MRQDLKGLGTYGTVGLEFGLSVLFGLLGGQWLDKKFGSSPWLALVGLGFGMAAGVRTLLRALKAAQRELHEEEQREREARRKYFERPPSAQEGKSGEPPAAP